MKQDYKGLITECNKKDEHVYNAVYAGSMALFLQRPMTILRTRNQTFEMNNGEYFIYSDSRICNLAGLCDRGAGANIDAGTGFNIRGWHCRR